MKTSLDSFLWIDGPSALAVGLSSSYKNVIGRLGVGLRGGSRGNPVKMRLPVFRKAGHTLFPSLTPALKGLRAKPKASRWGKDASDLITLLLKSNPG